jgi:hypothetical protein
MTLVASASVLTCINAVRFLRRIGILCDAMPRLSTGTNQAAAAYR